MTTTAIERTNNQAIPAAPRQVGARGITVSTFEDLWRLAKAFAASGLAPKGIHTPEAIFTAVELGLEIGLSPMSALQSIAIVNGRPSIYGDAALALVRGSGLCQFYTEFESNDGIHAIAEQLAIALEFEDAADIKRLRMEIAKLSPTIDRTKPDYGYTAISMRVGGVNSVVSRFTLADAVAARLRGKEGPWKQYERRMLMWRCRGFNLRDNYGDVLRGLATAEEAGDIPMPTAPVPSEPGESRMASITKRLTSRPVSEGQSFEPDPAAAAQAEAETTVDGQVVEPAEATEPDVSSVTPADLVETGDDLATEARESEIVTLCTGEWGPFKSACVYALDLAGVDRIEAEARFARHIKLKVGKAGKEHTIPAEQRRAIYDACEAGTL